MTEAEIQRAIAWQYKWWSNIIVPNVFLPGRATEMDVALLTPAGALWEFEIKRTMSDWRAERLKRKQYDKLVACRSFHVVLGSLLKLSCWQDFHSKKDNIAIPDHVPPTHGVLAVFKDHPYSTFTVRRPKANRGEYDHEKVRQAMTVALGRRYWKWRALPHPEECLHG